MSVTAMLRQLRPHALKTLRRDLEYGSPIVGAAAVGGAVEIALGVEGQTRVRNGAVAAAKAMQDAFIAGGIDFEHRTVTKRTAILRWCRRGCRQRRGLRRPMDFGRPPPQ
jgi:hypothetical protein